MKINEDLDQEIREVFEPLVPQQLSEAEVFEIASNLAGFAKVLLKMKKEDNENGK